MAELRTRQVPAFDDWANRYVPLLSIVVALALFLLVMPSSLLTPSPDPAPTLEFAPVPPSPEEQPPPPDGNVAALGLASSPGFQGDTTGGRGSGLGPGAGPGGPLGAGANPSNKRCVGRPPRQTEDPASPPCVAFFRGDNFGATYRGVTADEVRLLVYLPGNVSYLGTSDTTPTPEATYVDLFQPPAEDEHPVITGLRAWQRYFNDRFQTYGRAVHFYAYFGRGRGGPEERRADAADNFAEVKPFAVVTQTFGLDSTEVPYVEEMARRGVLNFGTLNEKHTSFYARFPGLIWAYPPPIERLVEHYVSFVCRKLVDQPVSHSGNLRPGLSNGSPRRFGLFHTADEKKPEMIDLAERVRAGVEGCGGEIVAEGTYPYCCRGLSPASTPDEATATMSEFEAAGVTTILWPGGAEFEHPKAGARFGYLPEWILLGIQGFESAGSTRLSSSGVAFDDRAFVVSPEVHEPPPSQQLCYQAFREADRESSRPDASLACEYYRILFQAFSGFQVAGPRLGPTSLEEGFRAIPAVPSRDNRTPACFYLPGDFTCVKDAQFMIWDDQGQPHDSNQFGCWRIIANAARYFPGQYPSGNLDQHNAQVGTCDGNGTSGV